jgi:hypothetical protein
VKQIVHADGLHTEEEGDCGENFGDNFGDLICRKNVEVWKNMHMINTDMHMISNGSLSANHFTNISIHIIVIIH